MSKASRLVQAVSLIGGGMIGGLSIVLGTSLLEKNDPIIAAIALLPFVLAGLTGIAKSTTA